MNTHDRLEQLMEERGWSMYKLSKESGLSESTIRNLFKRNTTPSIETLKIICKSFGITLSQFFAEGEMVEMSPALKELFDLWVNLTPAQKAALKSMMQAMQEN
jgi:transcriptional regulator with XRE-family HTH domain